MANSPILAIPLVSANQSAKETTINDAISFLEKATNDAQTLDFTAGDISLPLIDLQRYFIFKCTNVGVPRVLTIPSATRIFAVDNSDGASTVTVTRGAETLALPTGTVGVCYVDGTYLIFLYFSATGGSIPFTSLSDVPSNYTGAAGQFLRVTVGEDGIEFAATGAGVADFVDLNDVPAVYTGAAGYVVKVNATEDGLEFVNGGLVGNFVDLGDVPASYAGAAGMYLKVNPAEDGVEFVLAGDMISVFTDLGDVVGSYAGQAGKLVAVTALEDGLEFIPPASGTVANFVDLGDVPANYTGYASAYVRVNATADGLEFGAAGELLDSFLDLLDTPAAYTGFGGFLVRVNVAENALEFYNFDSIGDILDVDLTTPPADGDVLAYEGSSSKWKAKAPVIAINDQTVNYTLVLADAGKYVRVNNAAARQVTVPLNSSVAFPLGTQVVVRQVGAGQVEIVAPGGLVINTAETLFLRKQGSTATLIKVGTDEWDLTGDLEPV